MNDAFGKIADQIQRLAAEVPKSVLTSLTGSILQLPPQIPSTVVGSLLATVTQPDCRNMVRELFDIWQKEAPEISCRSIALALDSASRCEEQRRTNSSVELVWTGPDSGVVPLRRTDQALLELINSARHRIVVVCFASF